MKRILLAAILLAPLPALAEDITVSVGAVSEVWTLATTDSQKFEAWVKTAYPCMPLGSVQCNDPLDALAASESAWAKATLQGTADNVTRFQNQVAAAAAVQATTPIGFNVGTKAKK
jgi:hypothetical protein